jgi:hypothetical protein
MTIREVEATAQNIRYIVENMRERDFKEIMALRWDNDTGPLINDMARMAGPMWRVWEKDGKPVTICGVTFLRPGVVLIGAFGTRQWASAIKYLMPWVRKWLIPRLVAANVHRMECYALASATNSRKLIEALGGEIETLLHHYGREREDFILYVWRLDDGRRSILHGAGADRIGTQSRRDVGGTGEQRSTAAADGHSDGGPANPDAHTAVAAPVCAGRREPHRQDRVSTG